MEPSLFCGPYFHFAEDMPAPLIPGRLKAACEQAADRWDWLSRLPDVLQELQDRWLLTLGRPFEEASCAWVAPVTLNHGTAGVLKIGMPHMEGEHEIDGLRFWGGNATVRLFDADFGLNAMLLERCEPGFSLRTLPEFEQDAVIARLLRRLWRVAPKPHSFRPLSAMTAYWGSETVARVAEWRDAGLVSAGVELFAELSASAPSDVLLVTDLHAGNVLRGQREPWLVIDPKPFVGDPAYDATQHLFNCFDRMRSDADGTMRRFADLLGVDHERLRLWMFARAVTWVRERGEEDPWLEVARGISP